MPHQSAPGGAIEWDERKINGDGTLAERAWTKLDQAAVFSKFGGETLRMEFDKHLWTSKHHVSFGDLADWFARHLYLPRVLSRAVLEEALKTGVNQTDLRDTFAVATAWDEAGGRYRGIVVHKAPASVDNNTLVVRPDVAQAQIDREAAATASGSPTSGRTKTHDSIPPASRPITT